MYRGIIKFLKQEIVFNGHLQSVGASSVAYLSTLFALNKTPSIVMLIVIYTTFQVVYFYDRLRDLEKDRETNIQRVKHIRSNKNLVVVLGIFYVGIVIFGNLIYANLYSLLYCVGIIILGLLYPRYFKGLTRKIYFFKNIYVTSVYSVAVFYPLLFYTKHIFFDKIIIYLFIFVFLEMAVSQLSLDLKDIKSDKASKLKTLPVVYGWEKALSLLYSFSVLSFFVLLAFLPGDLRFFSFVFLIILNLIYNLIYIYYISKNKSWGYLLSAGKFSFWLLYLFLV